MHKYRRTEPRAHKESLKAVPITALASDPAPALFNGSKRRSINNPETKLAHQSITAWLNGSEPWFRTIGDNYDYGESKLRILALLTRVQFLLARFGEQEAKLFPWAAGRGGKQPSLPYPPDFYTTFPNIERLMDEYATVPYLAYQPNSRLWAIGQKPANPSQRPYGEVMAAHGVLEMVRCGAIDRMRQCKRKGCQRWFYAVRLDSVTCSDPCKKKYWREPEMKQLRSETNSKNHGLRQQGIGELQRDKKRTAVPQRKGSNAKAAK
jgi:hypothetical protein